MAAAPGDQSKAFPLKGKPWVGLTFMEGDFAAASPGSHEALVCGRLPGSASQGRQARHMPPKTPGRPGLAFDEGPGQASVRHDPDAGPDHAPMARCISRLSIGRLEGRPAAIGSTITPSEGKGKPFCGIDLDPKNPHRAFGGPDRRAIRRHLLLLKRGASTWTRYSLCPRQARGEQCPSRRPTPHGRGRGSRSRVGQQCFGYCVRSRGRRRCGICRFWPVPVQGIGGDQVTVSLVGEGGSRSPVQQLYRPSEASAPVSGLWGVGGFRHEALDQIPASRLRGKKAMARRTRSRGSDTTRTCSISMFNRQRPIDCSMRRLAVEPDRRGSIFGRQRRDLPGIRQQAI